MILFPSDLISTSTSTNIYISIHLTYMYVLYCTYN